MTEPNKTSEIITQPEGTYWHFLADDRCLGYSDGRKVVVGETLRMGGSLILCERGFHASPRVIDALNFAPGPIVCLVTLGGIVLHDTEHPVPDKSVAQERTALWMYDASQILREFACDVAEEALLSERKAGREPDPCLFAAISVMRRFMTGDATETERSAAYSAADNAAWSVAYSVVMNASKSAAHSAAESAADRAAWNSALNSAESAAESAAWNALGSMAYSSEWNATNNAAWSASNDRLTGMLLVAMARGEGDFPSWGLEPTRQLAA